jgi:hypothetical protein
MGLQEKVLTALELEDREDAFALLQRRDAIRSLNGFDRKRIPMNVPKHFIMIAGVLAGSIILVNFLPNPMDSVIRQRNRLRSEIGEQLEDLKETAEEELSGNAELTEEQKQELAELVRELTEKLKNTGDYKEALKEISGAEEELASLTDEIQKENLGQLTKQLAASEATRSLADALGNMDAGELEKEIGQLKEKLSAASGEELAGQLKDALQKAAGAMPAGAMKDSLVSIADQFGNGQSAAAAMEEFGELLESAGGTEDAAGEIKYALQKMRSKVAEAAGQSGPEYAGASGSQSTESDPDEPDGENTGQSGNGNSDSQGNQGQGSQNGQSGSPSGQGSNSGGAQGSQGSAGNGQGQGSQNGSGQGNSGNSGQSGSGVGDGTTNLSSGQGGNESAGSQGDKTGDENAQSVYERIYDPERLGDGGEVSHVSGQQTGSGETVTEDGKGVGDLSGYIPYREVYQEYRSEAMNSMDRRILPPNVRGLVRDYFDALGQ